MRTERTAEEKAFLRKLRLRVVERILLSFAMLTVSAVATLAALTTLGVPIPPSVWSLIAMMWLLWFASKLLQPIVMERREAIMPRERSAAYVEFLDKLKTAADAATQPGQENGNAQDTQEDPSRH